MPQGSMDQQDPGEKKGDHRDEKRKYDLFRTRALISSRGNIGREEQTIDDTGGEKIADQQKTCDQRTHLGRLTDDAEATPMFIGEKCYSVCSQISAGSINLF